MKIGLLLAALWIWLAGAQAQTCTERGQTPGTAFPVCGVKTFTQQEVKLCGNTALPGPCSNDGVTDQNPYWYKFTCYTSGTLGFLITPEELGDDYDWQLFDVTGRNVDDVYHDKNLFVACNWSGESGLTGASSDGRSLNVCAGPGQDLFSTMPSIQQGHEYLLLISHFTNTQSGYVLEFKGGTADITDPRVPVIERSRGSCSGNQIFVKLNKRMTCESLAADGSDFILPNHEATIIAAAAANCSGFDMDSIVLTLDHTIAASDYTIGVQRGTDGNTLLDNCGVEMPAATAEFTMYQDVSAAFVEDLHPGCVKDTLLLWHDGANGVNYWSWQFDGLSSSTLQHSSMLYDTGGEKKIELVVSNGHCNDTATSTVTINPKIKAAFTAPEILCVKDAAVFTDNSAGSVLHWEWDLGAGRTSALQNPEPFNYPSPHGEKTYRVKLTVAAGDGCTDSAFANVVVVSNCSIMVPSAFTPNNDGKNDFLYPSNAFNADNLVFRVFNRFGQMVFESRDWTRKWDGTLNGYAQAAGTYVWTLSYVLKTTKRSYVLKGATVLIR